ncbi:Golgi apparatus membrane protein TVP38 [Ramaria rubella]|nr:Golgi apparatus membrane protein TVP38 [Ramaria rubella]
MTSQSANTNRTKLRWCWQMCKHYVSDIYPRYRKLNLVGKGFVWFLILFHVALFALLVIFRPARIFQFLYNLSQQLKAMRFGWLILGGVMVVASFPPLVGYSTCVSVCGFAYGMQGYYVAGPATMLGSGVAFIVLRLLFSRQVAAWSSKHDKWQALEQVIAAKGLPLIILIRMSPFPPYVYSQALFASISVVKFWQFMLATFCFQPRIVLAVFIGSRIAKLSDTNQRGQMDTTTKILNAASIVVGTLLGLGVGWFLYWTTQEKIKSLKELSPGVNTLAVDAEDLEDAPLLRDFSSDTLVSPEEERQHSVELTPSRSQSPR